MIDDRIYKGKALLYEGIEFNEEVIFYCNDVGTSAIVLDFYKDLKTPYSLEGARVAVNIAKKDGNIVTDFMNITGENKAEYIYPINGLTAVGKSNCTILVYDGNGDRVTFGTFKFRVRADINGDVESTTEYPVLNKLISDVDVLNQDVNSAEALRIVEENHRKSNEVERKNNENDRVKTFNDIKNEYSSIKGIMIDENNAANLQNQINVTNSHLDKMASKEEVNNFIDSIKEVTFLDGFENNPYTISGDGQNTNSFTNSIEDFISNKVLNFTSTDNSGNVITINDVDLNNIVDYECEFSIEYKITGSNPLYVYTGFVDKNDEVINESWDYKTLTSNIREIFTFVKHIPKNAVKIKVQYATMSQTSFILGDIKLKKKGILQIDGSVVNKEKTITKVVASWGDFTSIASAIAWAENNINENTIINIDIVEDTYNECNLTITKDNINLIARSKKVVINADGTTTPSIPQPNRHGLMSQTTCHHKNLTIIAHATRYALHNDGGQPYNATFENCHFIYKDQDSSYGNPVGLGGLANQFLRFKDCTFEIQGNITKNIEYGMIWHNTASNSPKTLIILENCNFINCGYMHIFDCGSNAIDSVNIINCKTNSKNKGLLINAMSNSTPYSVEINTNATDIPMIEHTENRLKHYHLAGYDEKVKGRGIALGYAVAFDYANIGLSENSVKLCANKSEFYGVATSDINDYGYVVPKGKCSFVYALANSYVKGDMLKLNSLGQFEKTTLIDECVARVADNYNLSSNGLISALI